jgi:hypothetical protein
MSNEPRGQDLKIKRAYHLLGLIIVALTRTQVTRYRVSNNTDPSDHGPQALCYCFLHWLSLVKLEGYGRVSTFE